MQLLWMEGLLGGHVSRWLTAVEADPRVADPNCAVWLMDSYFVDHWEHNEKLAQSRLGFDSPDILVMFMGS